MPIPPPQRRAALAAALGVLLAAAPTRADEPAPAAGGPGPSADPAAPPPTAPPAAPPTAARRDGFTFGVAAGVGLASIAGYPNDATKIGLPAWHSATGVRPSTMLEGWIGGAITDWFTVGVGVKASLLLATGSTTARAFGGVAHIEAFPLFSLGGPLRDLGVLVDAGLGTATVTDGGGTKIVDGASTSIFGGGFFYEGLRAWKTAHGPFVMADYVWSDTASRPAFFVGWRSELYARP
jgi:hypothetical protein